MMNYKQRLFALGLLFVFSMSAAFAQEPIKQSRKQTLAAAALTSVGGIGTPGRISKWTGVDGSNTYFLGNSNIFEDKFGKVGIGTSTPTSLLTVQGMIETTMGGYKFPDGTIQTTAGLSSVFHDLSLTGNASSASPLGIAAGGVRTIHLANGAVTAPKIANDTVVRSLNGLFDNVEIVAGSNITVTPGANTLTIAAAGASDSLIEPVSSQVFFLVEDGSDRVEGTVYNVPAGKRLVIEHISARCILPVGQRLVRLSILTEPNEGAPTATPHGLVPSVIDSPAIGSVLTASLPIKLYAHSGTSVDFFAARSANIGTGNCVSSFSGFLVDLPQPAIRTVSLLQLDRRN